MNWMRLIIGALLVAVVWGWYRARDTVAYISSGSTATGIVAGQAGSVASADVRAGVAQMAAFRAGLSRIREVETWRSQFADDSPVQEETCVDPCVSCSSAQAATGATPEYKTSCIYPFGVMKCERQADGSYKWVNSIGSQTC